MSTAQNNGVFSVARLFRYPVKSMAGEEISEVGVTERGLTGDRAYALVDAAANTVGSAKNVKRFGELLRWRAAFVSGFEAGSPVPAVRLTQPDGSVLTSDDPNLAGQLEALFGSSVALALNAPEGLILEFAAGTLGGKFATTTQLPVSSGAPKGTLFNYASVHLITSASLRELEGAADRFRPNLIVDCGELGGFPENSWIGRTIAIGSEVRLRPSIPCPRCVVPTLARQDLEQDPAVLRRVAEKNTVSMGDFGDLPCAGIYADVIQNGRIRRGDTVRVLDE